MGRRFSMVVAVLTTVCAGCGPTDPGPGIPTSAPLSRAETRDVYRPPADGRITVAQVETYLSVLDRVRLDLRGARPTPAGDPLTMVPADVAAAMTARLNASALALLEKTLGDLKARRADAADDGSRKLLAEQTAQFEAEAERIRRESKLREPDSVRTNVKTLEPFRARLTAAQEALEKP